MFRRAGSITERDREQLGGLEGEVKSNLVRDESIIQIIKS